MVGTRENGNEERRLTSERNNENPHHLSPKGFQRAFRHSPHNIVSLQAPKTRHHHIVPRLSLRLRHVHLQNLPTFLNARFRISGSSRSPFTQQIPTPCVVEQETVKSLLAAFHTLYCNRLAQAQSEATFDRCQQRGVLAQAYGFSFSTHTLQSHLSTILIFWTRV